MVFVFSLVLSGKCIEPTVKADYKIEYYCHINQGSIILNPYFQKSTSQEIKQCDSKPEINRKPSSLRIIRFGSEFIDQMIIYYILSYIPRL